MRHHKSKNHLNRFTSWRKATLVSLARSLLINQSIRTTKAKAVAAKPLVDKLISLAKEDTLAAKRRAYAILCDHKLVKTLFEDIGRRFDKRQSGFTRMIKLGLRRGDNAETVIFELVEIKKKEVKKQKAAKEEKAETHTVEPAQESPEDNKPKDEKVSEKPPITRKPTKKFLGGLKGIFKKERDSL